LKGASSSPILDIPNFHCRIIDEYPDEGRIIFRSLIIAHIGSINRRLQLILFFTGYNETKQQNDIDYSDHLQLVSLFIIQVTVFCTAIIKYIGP
jgi:hypothetical protein